jgi:hypothetical protein
MTKNIINFFDKLEDKTRSKLSHYPLFYAFIGGVGIVLFWRGVWHTTDFIVELTLGNAEVNLFGLVDGPISFALGTIILLITGVYVSAFIGNRLIITGLNGEKKLAEKTEEEIATEEDKIDRLQKTINRVEEKIEKVESEINHQK